MHSSSDVDTRYYPAWGPYSKEHAGFSRRISDSTGYRLDCIVVPGIYRGRVFVPSAIWDSGCIVTASSADLQSVRMLHEMTESLTVETEWHAESDDRAHVRVRFRNTGRLPVAASCHLLLRMAPPRLRPGSEEVRMEVHMPESIAETWTAAVDYDDLAYARSRITDSLVYDGYRRGVEPVQGSVRGRAVAASWGAEAGDRLTVTVATKASRTRTVCIRYRLRSTRDAKLTVDVRGATAGDGSSSQHWDVVLPPSSDFAVYAMRVRQALSDDSTLELTSTAGVDGLCLDGFYVLEEEREGLLPDVCSIQLPADRPAVSGPVHRRDGIELAYPTGQRFRVTWDTSYDSVLRSIETRHLDEVMAHLTHNHVSLHLRDQRHPAMSGAYEPWYTDLFLRPVDLAADDESTLVFRVEGPFDAESPEASANPSEPGGSPRYVSFDSGADAETGADADAAESRLRLGAERLAAVALTNVVYPVQIRGRYMCHTTPGRFWDSVYTWDAGFAGIGLSVIAEERARESLETYLGYDHDTHRAFLHHGSPLPVQAYLAKELLDLNPEHAHRDRDYSRLLRYYEFLIGRLGSSATNPFKTGLRTTFAYFYNSGGWDDYPAQAMAHTRRICGNVAPVVTNAHLVRFARLLLGMSRLVGDTDRAGVYEQDIRELMYALRTYAWDSEQSLFGYVEHDDSGEAIGILRTPAGENANLGLDGISPLVTGALLPNERDPMLERLFSRSHLWTDTGVTTVDLGASYARRDGYWNGSVWMPHQWFFWKTCLDLGLGAYAWQIARTALELWSREVGQSGRTYEHFPLTSGRGAGWHQFGGLSSPVLNWFASYYQPGTVTAGFDTWICRRNDRDGMISLTLRVDESSQANRSSVLICPPGYGPANAHVLLNGVPVGCAVYGKALSIDLSPGSHELTVSYGSRETSRVSPM